MFFSKKPKGGFDDTNHVTAEIIRLVAKSGLTDRDMIFAVLLAVHHIAVTLCKKHGQSLVYTRSEIHKAVDIAFDLEEGK